MLEATPVHVAACNPTLRAARLSKPLERFSVKGVEPIFGLIGAAGFAGIYGIRNSAGASEIELNLYGVAVAISLALSLWGLLAHNNWHSEGRFRPSRMLRLTFAAIGAAWGLMLLGAVIALPLIGPDGFRLIVAPYGGIVWLCSAIVIAPVVERYLS